MHNNNGIADIQVALASDDGYVCGLIVTAASMAINVSKDAFIHFNVLDCGISDKSYDEICNRVMTCNPNVDFRRHYITEDMMSTMPKWHGGKATYARLFLPDLLPECDHVVYCDVDFLWVGDISELWSLRDDAVAMIGVHDAGELTLQSEEKWHLSHGLGFDKSSYFCAGLSFMNLNLFRERDISKKTIEFIEKYPDVQYPDQAALNYVLRGQVKLVDRKWQQFSGLLISEDAQNLCTIHYAGDTPWKRRYVTQMLTDVVLLWHSYYAKVYNITAWKSLRRFYPIASIIYRRSLWHCCRVGFLRGVITTMLNLVGKKMCAEYLKRASVPVDLKRYIVQ